ncbi:LysR family transcriptional regulator [Cellvibrio mixtus]|uniref:LysR family transcriptional regulator n=1 Tax=Cellvibrio mixtus TaxID=39650 RepID=A0A266Q9Y4_9GAMM|nr:LysR family transcriptional regulator [Cellvibrio mixtus]OZY86655.1 LysR family transcriptional regulator [Cellvibrio mixtus]
MFELSQLRCFLAVAEELHFSRAAERLNMTQPPLSRQIRLLEHHVGAQLLERTSRTVRLTAAGKAFFPDAARILRLAEEAAATARRNAKGERGSLSIGFTASFGYQLLPEMVRRLRECAPDISLTLKELVTGAQLDALHAGALDVGLVRPHSHDGDLETVFLAGEELYLAIPKQDADLWPTEPTLACLQSKPFLMYSPYEARYFHNLLSACFQQDDVLPHVVEYVAQMHTMLALVRSGIGVALIPKSASSLHFEGILLRQVITTPPKPVEMVYSYRKDNNNPALETFLKEVLPEFKG